MTYFSSKIPRPTERKTHHVHRKNRCPHRSPQAQPIHDLCSRKPGVGSPLEIRSVHHRSNHRPFDDVSSRGRLHRRLPVGQLAGQREKVLADPAIMPNVQLISLYDDGLSVDASTSLVAQDSVSDTLVARRTFFKPFLANYSIDADVAYAVSASSSHTRASAWFTTDDDSRTGVPFTLNGNQGFYHRFYNLIPGTVAIHSTATSLTALHEFGHAISSYTNGKILDLYVDSPVGFNNLVGRPIPSNFCNYDSKSFVSDPSRDSLGYPVNWQSYHCGLVDPACPAVMDNYWQSPKGPVACLHDSVTVAFIRDRVVAKIGRP